MSTQVTNYKCPACTGPLHFVGESGMLECDYCSSKYSVEEIEKLYAEKNENAEQNFEKIKDSEWDMSELNTNWQEDNMKAYSCPSCGAELICDEHTAATRCPYCGNPTVIPGQFANELKPDYVIPFKLSKEDAIKQYKEFYSGKKLLPKAFVNENTISEIQGVYVPFWFFNGQAYVDATFDGTKSISHRDGEYRITETSHFDVIRKGTVSFTNIPVDASKKMSDEHMDAIEPYDYNELKPFSNAYLPGYLAEKHSVSAEESMPRAEERAKNTALSLIRADAIGYETLTTKYHNVQLERGKIYYALLPVYMLTTKFQGQNYLFAMNGQTGKFIGNLPVDNGKYWTYFLGIAAGVTALIAVILTLLF